MGFFVFVFDFFFFGHAFVSRSSCLRHFATVGSNYQCVITVAKGATKLLYQVITLRV